MQTAQARDTLSRSKTPRCSQPFEKASMIDSWLASVEIGETALVASRPATSSRPASVMLPGLAVVGHVGVLVAVEASGRELLVDELGHRDARLAVLGDGNIAERAERRLLVGQ